ncbi:hypothetical protein P7C73_g1042, partial [Tremellales sp. Uapishka_1]
MMSPQPPPTPKPTTPYHARAQAVSGHMLTPSEASSSSDEIEGGHVRVVVRIRPSDLNDPSVPARFLRVLLHPISPSEVRVDVDPAALAGLSGITTKRHPTFVYDHVLPESSSQRDLYDVTARDGVDRFMKGYNVTVLAYGQTSSGKSYSMGTTGDDADYSTTEVDANPRTGLIPLTVQAIFEKAEAARRASGPGATWECKLSFLELYNEEMIDLLSGQTGIQVQIREGKDGRIIWSGLQEVKVKSTSDVMQLLKEGSARRRTGETGMNATSSRSHAVFSLTLVQKKRSGVSAPIPQPVLNGNGGRETPTPRVIKRPSSTVGFGTARAQTPSQDRSTTPTGSYNGNRPGLSRPSSMQVPHSPSPFRAEEDEWVTVTSKYNMVDLAGSERLKRTAAQGDRMREGISINSGLLALGNVISALADPAKAKTAHIPYRDSKLTRLLQDSLGGNAYTIMIACVSPIEYNVGETLNTLKYAARARNIKNAAKANQVEAGWDDVEHLQTTVLRLRKEMTSLKAVIENGGGSLKPVNEEYQAQAAKLLQRLADLQQEHTDLNDRYLQKASEAARLAGELRIAHASSSTASSFEDTVEPVIMEYERVVSSLNARLAELQANLASGNELYSEQETQLLEAQERQAQNDGYVIELRARVAKLNERETSHEAYIRDLETKLKHFTEREDSHSDIVAELRKEIAKIKETEATSSKYISELEVRLARTDTQSSDWSRKVESLEKEVEVREGLYRDLEARISLLDTSQESKALLGELDARDHRVADLERQLEQAVQSREQVGEEHAKLLDEVESEKSIQSELREQLSRLRDTTASRSVTPGDSFYTPADDLKQPILSIEHSPSIERTELTPPATPHAHRTSGIDQSEDAQAELARLRSIHQRTLAELDGVSSQYRLAMSEIAELSMQLSEAREMHDLVPPSPATRSETTGNGDEWSEAGTTLQTPPGQSPQSSPVRRKGHGRRESLPIISSPGSGFATVKQRDFRGGRGLSESKRIRPQSLSQELSSAGLSGTSPRTSWGPSSSLLFPTSPNRASMPIRLRPQRSASSLEAEVMRLQDALKDRESEIDHLEEALKESHTILSHKTSANTLTNGSPSSIPLPLSPATTTFVNYNNENENQNIENKPHRPTIVVGLSPQSSKDFRALKESLNRLENGAVTGDESQRRLEELMRSMAMKETAHVELVSALRTQIFDLLGQMKHNLGMTSPDHEATIAGLERERDHLLFSLKQAESSALHAADELREEHARELSILLEGHAQTIQVIQTDHDSALDTTRAESAAAALQLESQHASAVEEQLKIHRNAMAEFEFTHTESVSALGKQLRDVSESLETTRAQLREAVEAKMKAEETLASLPAPDDFISKEDHAMVLESMQEMENAMASVEEQKTTLKIENNRVRFELSKVRDEYAHQHRVELNEIADLQKTIAELSTELSSARAATVNRDSQSPVSGGFGRPPIGPPPSIPVPPIPTPKSPPMDTARASTSSHSSGEGEGSTLRRLEEQMSAMTEQLRHCEKELHESGVKITQLDSALKESERLCRKSRANEGVLKRDLADQERAQSALTKELMRTQDELRKLNTEVKSERESMEQRLEEERIAKEAARAQLERRVDNAAIRKTNSKFKETLDQCHPATFTWTSTQPPYYLSIIESSAQPSFLADAEIVKIPSANQATWIVDLPAGTNATVVVRDASGQMTASIPRIVGNGPSDCFFKDFTL